MSLKFYGNKVCPYVHRSWMVAVEKNVPIEFVEVPLVGGTPEWYHKINPRRTVPALTVGERLVPESGIIAEYLDAAYAPPSSLFTTNPTVRAAMRLFMDECNALSSAMYGALRAGSAKERDEKTIDAALYKYHQAVKTVEARLVSQSEGPFFLGVTFSMADIHILPFLDRLRAILPALALFREPLANAPRLRRLLAAAELRPSFQRTSQPPSVYVAGYSAYMGKDSSDEMIQPTLYVNRGCPYANRAEIAAALAGVKVNRVEVPLPTPTWYHDINPRETVPAVIFPGGGAAILESLIVARYLAESAPESGKNLIPEEPLAAASMNVRINDFEVVRNAFGELLWAGEEERSKKLETFKAELKHFDETVTGPLATGEEITLADVSMLPFLARFAIKCEGWEALAPKSAKLLEAARVMPELKAHIHTTAEYIAMFA